MLSQLHMSINFVQEQLT